jgi:hypothetical protein
MSDTNIVAFPDRASPDRINVELVETNVLTRWPCTVCGGCTEKVPILAEGNDFTGRDHTGRIVRREVRVCERCLEMGNIDERLREHVASITHWLEFVRSLVGRLHVPSYEAWKARYDAHEEEWVRANTPCASNAEYEAARKAAEREAPSANELPF